MSRNPDYQHFLNCNLHPVEWDGLPLDEETTASPQHMGWRYQWQVRRALHNARNHVATPEEIDYLRKHHLPVSPHSVRRTKRYLSS